ncbi:hypothetical protein ACV0NV_004618 [Klebsiella pneumoniae]|uniref:hypothetical protein n=1 Tax=Klebsiella pneumoniae TaxID=573 RepID=UPI0003BF3CEC|nr:hypothetical protein [Klebsiella pneumoniae]HDS5027405.1 hypothetical protein [Klebsiella pneumoniae subsp. ozaenae]ELA2293363.1 hypothetical protein [Klebsiella pneumoniae]ELA2364676.1 hypothetical protein [Klebsiella pneumoniae]ELA2391306.1 hypothetical protein [Klebsiella pneumoniae]ELC3569020.1 hypothetical protein [Klebsiella pneumoniae]
MDSSLEYACKRLQELESLLLADVPETVWPAEVSMVFAQIEKAGTLPAPHQRRLQHHINRMWLEKMPVPSIIAAARSLVSAMEKYV